MKTNLFKRVYLNGDPERLPKERVTCIVGMLKPPAISFQSGSLQYREFIPGETDRYWLENIAWYEISVTREEIIKILKTSPRIMEKEDYSDYYIDNIDEVADEIIGGNK